jgi:hypothetical protein
MYPANLPTRSKREGIRRRSENNCCREVGLDRVERSTSCVSGRCSSAELEANSSLRRIRTYNHPVNSRALYR